MLTKDIIEKWHNGIYTDYGVYDACDTDEKFYNFLKNEGIGNSQIKETMLEVSGSDDAYNNVMEQKDVTVEFTAILNFDNEFEREVKMQIWFPASDFDDPDDDEEVHYKIEREFEAEILDRLTIELNGWKRI